MSVWFPFRTMLGAVASGFVIGVMYAGPKETWTIAMATVVEALYIALVLYELVWAFVDAFNGTRFHHTFTVVRIVDTYLAFVLSATLISFMLWQFDLSAARTWSWSIGNASPGRAYQLLLSYTMMVTGTGGPAFLTANSFLSQLWASFSITAAVILQKTLIAASVAIVISNLMENRARRKKV